MLNDSSSSDDSDSSADSSDTEILNQKKVQKQIIAQNQIQKNKNDGQLIKKSAKDFKPEIQIMNPQQEFEQKKNDWKEIFINQTQNSKLVQERKEKKQEKKQQYLQFKKDKEQEKKLKKQQNLQQQLNENNKNQNKNQIKQQNEEQKQNETDDDLFIAKSSDKINVPKGNRNFDPYKLDQQRENKIQQQNNENKIQNKQDQFQKQQQQQNNQGGEVGPQLPYMKIDLKKLKTYNSDKNFFDLNDYIMYKIAEFDEESFKAYLSEWKTGRIISADDGNKKELIIKVNRRDEIVEEYAFNEIWINADKIDDQRLQWIKQNQETLKNQNGQTNESQEKIQDLQEQKKSNEVEKDKQQNNESKQQSIIKQSQNYRKTPQTGIMSALQHLQNKSLQQQQQQNSNTTNQPSKQVLESKDYLISRQTNYYFSDKNFYKDKYLMSHTVKSQDDGYIDMTIITNFPKIKNKEVSFQFYKQSLNDFIDNKFNLDRSQNVNKVNFEIKGDKIRKKNLQRKRICIPVDYDLEKVEQEQKQQQQQNLGQNGKNQQNGNEQKQTNINQQNKQIKEDQDIEKQSTAEKSASFISDDNEIQKIIEQKKNQLEQQSQQQQNNDTNENLIEEENNDQKQIDKQNKNNEPSINYNDI
ncbi:hypothetical protein PPERSA_04910 [Pseudocohnilembus persalinus]|uniref:HTH La-type RNA-binding domain-containing protein n=1 Tax=Pseudocohnilembus persalinus TaxID=266149 RepID=A0A0V0QJW2_PSEPJ|nr:hypothetical protein PPERSA_04910 [Pseudocohnilembus persalinus]|eukprot:KRX02288.1 hypothetical protein PPERSA_04910 [Pseudocohnilembus persalinus]